MKISIIGNGGHSKRIQKILSLQKLQYIIYKPEGPKYFDKKEFEKVKECNIIFIISPNKTHFKYIKQLYKNRFIFCEKPIVTSLNEINFLKKINNKKIYVNFNFRFSKIGEILQLKNKYKLGELLYANFVSSNGLALKKDYKIGWRSDLNKCEKGIFEIVSVHFIDIINYFFKIHLLYKPVLSNKSGIGSSFDTSHTKIEIKNKSIIDIFTTYNSPYKKKIFFLFTNGIIEQNNNQITVRGPAKNFDKDGFFITPKLIFKSNISDNTDYKNSLTKSINFFLNHAKKNKNFEKKIFETSLGSNKFLF